MNIYQAITAAMADVEPIAKGRYNKDQRFSFRGIDEVMNELQPILKKHGLFVVPKVVDVIRQEKPTKSGGMLLYSIVTMEYTMYAQDGSSITGSTVGEGMDSGDKASNKAMAVALKYFLLQTFCIPTEDAKDPDAESHVVLPNANNTTKDQCTKLSNELNLDEAWKRKLWNDSGKNWSNLLITLKSMKEDRDLDKAADIGFSGTENVQKVFGGKE